MKNNIDFLADPNQYRRASIKVYKKIFAGTIKESFLISTLNKVENDPRYVSLLLSTFNPEVDLSAEAIIIGRNNSMLNICKMIVMIHYMNTFMLSDNERGKKQEDRAYVAGLINDVIKMLKIEKLAVLDYPVSSLESFLPLIYYISALNNYCGNKYGEFTNQQPLSAEPTNKSFNLNLLYKIIFKIRACISLSNINATDEMIVIFRSLAELFMTYVALWDQKDAIIQEYYKFDHATLMFNRGEEIPNEIKTQAKKKKADYIKYLNYGWIEFVKEYNLLEDCKKGFGLGSLAEMLDLKYYKGFGTDLYKIYKACNPQTHGTIFFMNYFELELHIFLNVSVMLKFICQIMSESLFRFDFKLGDIDLIDELNAVLDASKKAQMFLDKNDELLKKTNNDYKDRAVCAVRMKK